MIPTTNNGFFLVAALAFFSPTSSPGELLVGLAALCVAAEQILRLFDRLTGKNKLDESQFVSKEDFRFFQTQILESINRLHARLDQNSYGPGPR